MVVNSKNSIHSPKKSVDQSKQDNTKAKSFVQVQMVRELQGPGALIAMSNKHSVIGS
jgi:hypothetical protein